jgi:hypothetical protein
MTDSKRVRQAREYIDEIVSINRRDGADPKLTKAAYDRAVKDAAMAFSSLAQEPHLSSDQRAKGRR